MSKKSPLVILFVSAILVAAVCSLPKSDGTSSDSESGHPPFAREVKKKGPVQKNANTHTEAAQSISTQAASLSPQSESITNSDTGLKDVVTRKSEDATHYLDRALEMAEQDWKDIGVYDSTLNNRGKTIQQVHSEDGLYRKDEFVTADGEHVEKIFADRELKEIILSANSKNRISVVFDESRNPVQMKYNDQQGKNVECLIESGRFLNECHSD